MSAGEPDAAVGTKLRSTDSEGPAHRHPEFYQEFCILRVEDTLFKVQKSLLIRDSPVFATLFSVLRHNEEAKGASDDDPIRLKGASASDFARLLTYMMKPAFEMLPNAIPLADLPNITSVARLAHNYKMKGWVDWCTSVLSQVVSADAGSLSSQDFAGVFKTAIQLGDSTLENNIRAEWLKRILRGELPSGPAMDVVHEQTRPQFLTELYTYELERLLKPRDLTGPLQPTPFNNPNMAPIHMQRVLAAYYSLSSAWAHFVSKPIALSGPCPHGGGQPHEVNCVTAFATAWSMAIYGAANLPLHKTYERVSAVRQTLVACRINSDKWPWCSYPASDPLAKILSDLPKTLESHFFIADNTPA
ncbi:hypothetical protein C8F01DRAFT_1376625 [Mycena amicta]|nr:hypothetical protein C8F01DRAFT_1376625 [Mycena amicta]